LYPKDGPKGPFHDREFLIEPYHLGYVIPTHEMYEPKAVEFVGSMKELKVLGPVDERSGHQQFLKFVPVQALDPQVFAKIMDEVPRGRVSKEQPGGIEWCLSRSHAELKLEMAAHAEMEKNRAVLRHDELAMNSSFAAEENGKLSPPRTMEPSSARAPLVSANAAHLRAAEQKESVEDTRGRAASDLGAASHLERTQSAPQVGRQKANSDSDIDLLQSDIGYPGI
jgi:hypothetical protein